MQATEFIERAALHLSTTLVNLCREAGVNVGVLILRVITRTLWIIAGNMTPQEFAAALWTAQNSKAKPCGKPGCHCEEMAAMEKTVAELMGKLRDDFLEQAHTSGLIYNPDAGDVPEHLENAPIVDGGTNRFQG